MSYKVNCLTDSHESISKLLEGETNFILRTEDIEEVFNKYDIDIKDKKISSLLTTNDYKKLFSFANSKNKNASKFTKYMKDYVDRMERLHKQNPKMYRQFIRIINGDLAMTDEQCELFKFPELTNLKDDIAIV